MLEMPNLRIVNRYGETGGSWYIEPHETDRVERAKRETAFYQREEPGSDWRLETRGDWTSWHRWRD